MSEYAGLAGGHKNEREISRADNTGWDGDGGNGDGGFLYDGVASPSLLMDVRSRTLSYLPRPIKIYTRVQLIKSLF